MKQNTEGIKVILKYPALWEGLHLGGSDTAGVPQ